MDVAYFGWRGNGIHEICSRLSLDVEGLTDEQAFYVAALLKAPLPKSPSQQYKSRLSRRVDYIRRISRLGISE